MGTDWQVKRPPPTPAEKKLIDAAKRENEKDRIKDHDARVAEDKRYRQERAEKLKQMGPVLEKRRTECRLRVLEMLPEVRKLRLLWDGVVTSMTNGYSKGYKSFTDTLELGKRHDEQMAQVAFSLLSMVSVGGLAMFSTFAQNKWVTSDAARVFLNSAEDGVQVGADKLISGLATFVPTTSAQDIPLPINYKGELDKVLNKYEGDMNEWIRNKGELFRTAPLDLFEAFDENDLEAQIESFWSSLHRDFGPVPVDEKAFEKEIELGLWAYWLGHKIRVGGRWTVVKWIAGSYEGMSLPILRRLHDLKLITKSEEQGIYFEADRWSQHVFQKLEKWGANWRPSRQFGKS